MLGFDREMEMVGSTGSCTGVEEACCHLSYLRICGSDKTPDTSDRSNETKMHRGIEAISSLEYCRCSVVRVVLSATMCGVRSISTYIAVLIMKISRIA